MGRTADYRQLRSIGKVTKPEGQPKADREDWMRPRPVEARHVDVAFSNFEVEGKGNDAGVARVAIWRKQQDGAVFLERLVEVSGPAPTVRIEDAPAGEWLATVYDLEGKSVKGDVYIRGVL